MALLPGRVRFALKRGPDAAQRLHRGPMESVFHRRHGAVTIDDFTLAASVAGKG